MTISELSSRNFSVTGTGKKIMQVVGVRAPALVFFKADNCRGSQAFEPEFYRLSTANDMFYGVVNISRFRDIPPMSRGTSTEIRSVPLVIFYDSDGTPKIRFNAKNLTISNIQYEIKNFTSKAQEHPGYYPPAQGLASQQFVPQFNMAYQGGGRPPAPGGDRPRQGQNIYYPSELGADKTQSSGANFDETHELTMPDNVTPYNVPWQVDLKRR